jgi:[ribosomal protein S18]-alanine N-acetyltransferase
MSAQLKDDPHFRPMQACDLDHVSRIEQAIYSHPWSRGNFSDSLEAGYSCWALERGGILIGYGILMLAADEAHLLNLSIAAQMQRRGYGRALLHHFMGVARQFGAASIYLEVRPSNRIARDLYRHEGFREIGVRRGYYPSDFGREDAIVMERKL